MVGASAVSEKSIDVDWFSPNEAKDIICLTSITQGNKEIVQSVALKSL